MQGTRLNRLAAILAAMLLGMPFAMAGSESQDSGARGGAGDASSHEGAEHGMHKRHGDSRHHASGDEEMRHKMRRAMMRRHAMHHDQPTLKVEAKAGERELKLVCDAEMSECLEAFDRVHAAVGRARE